MTRLPVSVLSAVTLGLGVTLCAAGPLPAQQSPWELGAGAVFERYTFSDEAEAGIESISLLTLPFGASSELGGGVDFAVQGAWAKGRVMRADGSELELSGLTDTEVRLGWNAADNAFRIELVGVAPTGKATHDEEEAGVAGAIAADLLPFRVSNWGTAGAVAANVSAARRWGAFGAGASVSYRVSDDFDPVEDVEFAYEPGDELSARVALEYTTASAEKLSVVVGLRSYSEDVANDANLFQTGDRFEVLATWAFPVSFRSAGSLYAGLTHRESGTFLDEVTEDLPSQNLILLGGVVRLPMGDGFLSPRADVRIFRPDDDAGRGFVAGAGVSLELPVGGRLTALPSATARFGNVELRRDSESDFFGLQAGLTLRLGRGGR